MLTFHFFATLTFLSFMLSVSAQLLRTELYDNSPSGYVKLPLQHKQISSPLRKRQSDVSIKTEELGWSYIVNVTIGSDKQTVPLIFDTGSSVTWVNPDCLKISEDRAREKDMCLAQHRYNPFTSDTAKILNSSFNITYGRGGVLGPYFTDDFAIGTATAKAQQFGVAAFSWDMEAGILGAGGRSAGYPAPIIESLAAQGQINSYAFSVDLRSMDEFGTVILGGIDTKKYKCGLTKVNGINDRAYLTDIGMTLPNKTMTIFDRSSWRGNRTQGLPVLFDTGTPTNLLPNALYFSIAKLYPNAVPYESGRGWSAYSVPCDAPLGTFDYSFGDTTIQVPFQDSLYKNEAGNCTFGFTLGPQDEGKIPYILADTFMRGAYMVFDRDNKEIWIGESADCGSNIVPIGKGKDAVPVIPGCGCEAKTTTSGGYAPPPGPTAIHEADYVQ